MLKSEPFDYVFFFVCLYVMWTNRIFIVKDIFANLYPEMYVKSLFFSSSFDSICYLAHVYETVKIRSCCR